MFKVHARRLIVFILLGLAVGLFYGATLPKLYEAKAYMIVDESDPKRLAVSEEVARLLSGGYTSGIGTELAVLASKVTFAKAADKVINEYPEYRPTLRNGWEDLFDYYTIGGQARLIEINTKAHDPQLAAHLANQIFAVYSEERESNSARSLNDAVQHLRKQEEITKGQLAAVERKIKDFRQKHNLASAEGETGKLATYVAQLEQQRDQTQTELRSIEAQIASQRAKLQNLPQFQRNSYSVQKTQIVTTLETQVANLQTARLVALKDYREDSQRVRSMDEQIRNLEAQLVKERERQWQENTQNYTENAVRQNFEGELARAEVQRRSLQARLSQANNLLGEQHRLLAAMPEKEMEFAQMQRERAQLERQYNAMLSERQDIEVKQRAKLGQATIYDPARPQPDPVAPDMAKMGIFGTIAGACLGLLFSFLFEALRLPVRSSQQLTELTGLPVAATVPLMPRRRARKMLAALPSPDAKPSESFRFMAFSQLAREGGAPKIVMFTGIGGSVGCSSSAGQFALATAQTGVRTLLVDCDLRHPALTTAFEVNDKSGLSDMLGRTMLASDSVDLSIETPHENLKIVPAGTESGQTGGLAEFPTSHIVGIIENFKERADVIVLDAPPCDVVSDASRLVPYVDQVNLVISAAATSFRSVPIAYELLRRAGAKEINMILTHASPQDEPFTKRSKYLVTNR